MFECYWPKDYLLSYTGYYLRQSSGQKLLFNIWLIEVVSKITASPQLKPTLSYCNYVIFKLLLLSVNLLLKFPGFFPGFPLNFQDISGIKPGRWGTSFLSPEFCTPAGRRTLFWAGERKNPGWSICAKFSATSKSVFCRIRNERFQGNPGNWLVFFTVCDEEIPWTAVMKNFLELL